MDLKFSLPKRNVRPLVDRLEADELVDLKPEDVADSIQAVAAITAFLRPNDAATQGHFRDIIQILTITPRPFLVPTIAAPVARSMMHFADKPQEGAPEVEKVNAPSGRAYELVTTPGCIAFDESQFTFMIRARGTASPCERGQ